MHMAYSTVGLKIANSWNEKQKKKKMWGKGDPLFPRRI